MTRPRIFAQVDVFSTTPYCGNPVAVILDGEGLDDKEMLQVARWTNLSETTFIFQPTTQEADYLVRIFTPGGELPFAGHPTLGSAHAWLENGGVANHGQTLIQQCGAGLIKVRYEMGKLSFRAPNLVRSGNLDENYLEEIAASFGIKRKNILAHQWVDNGPGWAVIRLETAQEVLDLEPDLTIIPNAMVGAIGAYPAGSKYAFEMRTFAPAIGIAEDPVCGSMNASVGQWITRSGEFTKGYKVSQGLRLGRKGEISITTNTDGEVWVGGATKTLFSGSAII
ncbi:PhzF family phenazine biosynthesis protein [Acidithrix ferrooxidans]|uniref:Trans-2,3-dihydro-3-hydroxyanthranilate isomerase n=1 Tax=Acidithrix ferrooxidans TaxID=1280514 RepID=A0A0D8HDX9_9ACTN|nr:PhzF family phenazine biosynthesis protein [Acidithrix ferrooxidans]KJF16138.1 trans-2,3-dihydro-3-hydroxyanthranilate isomerase [Acidithrix ferrooxidans]